MDAEPRTLAGQIAALPATPWYEPETGLHAEPDGYFVDRAAVLALLQEAEARADTGLDAAWKAAEAALPEGWIVAGVDLAGPSLFNRVEFIASAWGPWDRSKRSAEAVSGHGDTPAAALRDLAARLGEGRE